LEGIDILHSLRSLVGFSKGLANPSESFIIIKGFPLTEEVLIDSAVSIIKYGKKGGEKFINDDGLLDLFKMVFKVNSNKLSSQHPFEIAFRIGYTQFNFQERPFNLLARNLYIYFHFWKKVSVAKHIDILADIQEIIGIPYDLAIFFALALVGNKQGYVFPYSEETLIKITEATSIKIDADAHNRFLQWCSADYEFYKSYGKVLPSFIAQPIVNTKEYPKAGEASAHLIISYNGMFQKVTSGIYYALIDKYNLGGKKNEFKRVFGYVFQEYVGELLKYSLNGWSIIPEIKYKNGKNFVDSIDWFVQKEDKLILVEVKQSSVFLDAKYVSKMEDISKDLDKTLVTAVKQLVKTHAAITSKKHPEFELFREVKHFQSLIVVYDPIYNGNNIVKKIIKKSFGPVSISYGLIGISDFEVLLDNQMDSGSLFELLEYKQIDKKEFDFKEFTISMYPDGNKGMRFLKHYYESFFDNVDKFSREIKE